MSIYLWKYPGDIGDVCLVLFLDGYSSVDIILLMIIKGQVVGAPNCGPRGPGFKSNWRHPFSGL